MSYECIQVTSLVSNTQEKWRTVIWALPSGEEITPNQTELCHCRIRVFRAFPILWYSPMNWMLLFHRDCPLHPVGWSCIVWIVQSIMWNIPVCVWNVLFIVQDIPQLHGMSNPMRWDMPL